MSSIHEKLKQRLSSSLDVHTNIKKDFAGFEQYSHNNLAIIKLDKIKPNPKQPRLLFVESEIQALADNIAENGLLQPITVRNAGTHYEIVAGERRFRALQLLNKNEVECLVVNISDKQNALLALSENLSRVDLSDYEIAKAVASISYLFDGKSDLARHIGLSRAKIYKLFAFQELPSIFITYLEENPRFISADTAEKFKHLQKHNDVDAEIFDKAVKIALEKLSANEFSQTSLNNVIYKLTQELLASNSSTDKVNAPEFQNIEFEGRKVGRFKNTGPKLILDLDCKYLTPEKEHKLMEFLKSLF